MPDRTVIFLGWSANLSNFLGLGLEAGASPMYPQKVRVPPLGGHFFFFFFFFFFCYSHQSALSVSDYSWEVYIVDPGVFAG